MTGFVVSLAGAILLSQPVHPPAADRRPGDIEAVFWSVGCPRPGTPAPADIMEG